MISTPVAAAEINRPTSAPADVHGAVASHTEAVSWPAIIAGAFVALAASLVLLMVGAGVGLDVFAPRSDGGFDIRSLTVDGAISLIVTEWLAAGLGGYIAGRLRRRWHRTHAHEVFFRDTAHGLITWSLATVFVVSLSSSAVMRSVAETDHIPAATALLSPVSQYDLDRLFRPSPDVSASTGGAATPESAIGRRTEVQAIVQNFRQSESLPGPDRLYLQQLVIQNTGVAAADAQKRVEEFLSNAAAAIAKSKDTAAEARRAASQTAIFLALSLAIGAFIASVSAALGGRLRDEHP